LRRPDDLPQSITDNKDAVKEAIAHLDEQATSLCHAYDKATSQDAQTNILELIKWVLGMPDNYLFADTMYIQEARQRMGNAAVHRVDEHLETDTFGHGECQAN
jgi:hypothetical protein